MGRGGTGTRSAWKRDTTDAPCVTSGRTENITVSKTHDAKRYYEAKQNDKDGEHLLRMIGRELDPTLSCTYQKRTIYKGS